MKKIKHLIVHVVAISGLVWSATAAAVSVNAGPGEGTTADVVIFEGAAGSGHQGQEFMPNENEQPATDPDTAFLQEIEVTRGSVINANVGDAETYIDIYQPALTGTETFATATLIGSSINAQDTTDSIDGTNYTFQFDNLPLYAKTEYLFVFRDASNNKIKLNLQQSSEASIGGGYTYGGGALFDYDSSGADVDINLDFTLHYSTLPPAETDSFTAGVTEIWGEWSSGMQGQAFIPRVNAVPNPEGTPTTVFLQNMQFTLGGFDNEPGDATTTLSIYLADSGLLSGLTLVGSSSNTVDTTNAIGDLENTFGLPPLMYNFEFDDLELFYNTTYIALFTDSLGNVIKLNIEQGFEGDISFPAAVPQTAGGGGLFDYDAFGWSEVVNADFTATYATSEPVSIPVMGWFGLLTLSVGLVFIGRSRVSRQVN